MSEISGRLAVVTGGSRGIGREIAIALAAAGANVIIVYHSAKGHADVTLQQITSKGRKGWVFKADLANAENVVSLAKQIRTECKSSVSILVNNAGISKKIPIEKLTIKDWNETIATNLTSAFLMSQMVIPEMRKQRWGRIINLSSIAAQTGGVIGPAYASSKAGLIGLTHSYASLLARDGITVNALAPAIIETDMLDEVPTFKPTQIPVGRFGEAKEVASMVVELANNGYITGQTININGGWYMA